MAVLLPVSEIKCLLATKSLQMSFTISDSETVHLAAKALEAVCKYTNGVLFLPSSILFTTEIEWC